MQKKYLWNDKTIDSVDWLIHSKALQTLTANGRKTCTQFIHEWLPVNGHPGQAKPTHLQTCPTCKSQKESQEHFLSCLSQSESWQHTIQEVVLNDQGNKKHNELNLLITWALTNCRNNNNIQCPATHRQFQSIIQDQTNIGWVQIIKVRWSTKWVQIYEEIYAGKGEKYAANQQSGKE
jgi:hypothetical protein